MSIPDETVRDLTISHIKNVLKEEMPRGGKKYPYVTENQVKAFKARFELQVTTARKKEAERIRKQAEKDYAEAKKISDAEEKKRKDAESLGVVLKVKDPELEKVKAFARTELDRLNGLLEQQKTRRAEQEKRLEEIEVEYATRIECVGVYKEKLHKAEVRARETLGYRITV